MALTRKMLKAMGIEEEKIDQIIEAHTETVDSFKEKVSEYKDKAEKYDDVKKELDELKDGDNDWQKKYEKEHSDFEAYKNDVTAKETKVGGTSISSKVPDIESLPPIAAAPRFS